MASCFDEVSSDAKSQVMECIWAGRPEDAAELLEGYADMGEARPKPAARVAGYLRNNADHIRGCPPSLGTMEAEQQHLYGSRMKSVPCGWSVRGASDMARIRSRKYSGREIPMPTRDSSLSPKRRKARQKRIDAALRKEYRNPIECEGHGWDYPYRASTAGMRAEVRYHAGLTGDHKLKGF